MRRTPLSAAIEFGYRKIVQLLLEAGANIDAPEDFLKRTPLTQAVKHTDILALLLQKGVNLTGDKGKVLMTLAVKEDITESVKLLASAGVPVQLPKKKRGASKFHFELIRSNQLLTPGQQLPAYVTKQLKVLFGIADI